MAMSIRFPIGRFPLFTVMWNRGFIQSTGVEAMWISALNMMGKSDTRIWQTFYVLPLLIMAEMFENVGFKNPTYIWISACAGMTAEVLAKIAPPVFRRPFASSVYIVAWALPTIIIAKRGRLKFWVWFVGKAHAMGFYSLLLRFFAVGRILESDIFNIGFSETIDASNVFVGYKYPTYI